MRTGLGVASIRQSFLENLFYLMGRFPEVATPHDLYMALAYTVRDRLLLRWVNSSATYLQTRARTVCYLSAEFMLGPQLGVNLVNLGIRAEVEEAMRELGLKLDELADREEEPGLGNGGLGRLAACYLDSLATLQIPAIGYGIRYEFGIFDQRIEDGWQVEVADNWLRLGNPWEIQRPEIAFEIGLGGYVEHANGDGRFRAVWKPERTVRGTACDTPILGYRVNTANFLRLWRAEAHEALDIRSFNQGDYARAVEQKVSSETISKVLYPNDEALAGKRLRLSQQYFMVSCTLRDMLRIFQQADRDVRGFAGKYVVQLNDTHPSIAVAELMRLLVDDHDLTWDEAWRVTTRTFAYTNHTLLPEALERWPVSLLADLLPRHIEIIYEINRRFLEEVKKRFPNDEARVRRMSLIDESGKRSVRMALLAVVGSFCVNGVAALHSELLRHDVLGDFYEMWPEKFLNVTNGVTPRRFVIEANPGLSSLLCSRIGSGWARDLSELRKLEGFENDPALRAAFRASKLENKQRFAAHIKEQLGVVLDPNSLFDVQAKRIHEYKRQHLNLLHVITLYNRLRRGQAVGTTPRTVIFAGKAAPGYRMAKLVIRLVHGVAEAVAADPIARQSLSVLFFPDFNVKNAQRLYPAADLSEQISTAGKEASGTGNMKFMMNGAVTIGTLDGANVEILEEVGKESFFLFGMTTDQVKRRWAEGYDPRAIYRADGELAEAIDQIASGAFSRGDREIFAPLVNELLGRDSYLVLGDYADYVRCQAEVSEAYADVERWTTMALRNVARSGKFSSDRSIGEYVEKIWKVSPTHVSLDLLPEEVVEIDDVLPTQRPPGVEPL